jgi:hypothetical protein
MREMKSLEEPRVNIGCHDRTARTHLSAYPFGNGASASSHPEAVRAWSNVQVRELVDCARVECSLKQRQALAGMLPRVIKHNSLD